MKVAVELPDDIVQQLETAWHDMPHRVLEAVAVEGYHSGALTHGHVQRLLQLSWWKTEALLKERQAYLPYNEEDLEHDRAALDHMLSK